LQTQIKTGVNVLLFVLGSIAVIMIIIGGIRYTTSNGEASQIKSAKDTIMYAVIGLVVAILAYSIVNFVVDQFV
jgi:multisubunit Na+/H+ antiporter MnhB subunit